MLDHHPLERRLIAQALGKIIDATVREHASSITQEAQLTARIGQALETELDGQEIVDCEIRIVTQDFPDRGPGALEKAVGADLYVGIETNEGGVRESKGFLVQAKLRDHPGSMADLRDECGKMIGRTDASYVWLYGDNGLRVIGAEQVLEAATTRIRTLPARRGSTLFARVLECREGARSLGPPPLVGSRNQRRSALADMLRELRTPHGVAVSVNAD